MRPLIVAAAGVLGLLCSGCGDDPKPRPAPAPSAAAPTPAATPAATATPTPTPTPTAPPRPLWRSLETRGRHIAVGVPEPNPNFVTAATGVPAPFERWRRALGRMH